MSNLSYKMRHVVQRITDAPQRTLEKVTTKIGSGVRPALHSSPPPAHVNERLESVFEALSELMLAPHVAAALELACDVLQSELPSEAVVAGLHDIDADEIRFVVARGVGHDLLRGTALPRGRCLVGHAAEHAVITHGAAEGADWIGGGGEDSTVLLCPILSDTNLLGVIALSDPLCAAQFSRHDVELVKYVAGQLARFIHAQRQRPPVATGAGRHGA